MRFNIPGHHIYVMFFCLMGRFQHRIGFAGACRISQENLQLPFIFFQLLLFLILKLF